MLFESTGRGKSKSVELEDVKFHQCVRLSRLTLEKLHLAMCELSHLDIWIFQVWKWQNNILHSTWWRVWADVLQTQHPCQGICILQTITTTFLCVFPNSQPLIWIESVIERHAHSRIEIMVKAKSQFKRRLATFYLQVHTFLFKRKQKWWIANDAEIHPILQVDRK